MENNKINLKDGEKVQIIHHWDCDGLCSAVLLFHRLKELNKNIKVFFMHPVIGNYFITGSELKAIGKNSPDHIFIADMAFPENDIKELGCINPNIYIFDHHKQPKMNVKIHINPFICKKNSTKDFYSTGWNINAYFGKEQNILSVLGSVGDLGTRISEDMDTRKIIKSTGLEFKDFLEMASHINSFYIVNKKEIMAEILNLIISKWRNPKEFQLKLKSVSCIRDIEDEINFYTREDILIEKSENIIIKSFTSKMHIISEIARRLSKKYPEYIIIAIKRKAIFGDGDASNICANIYVRRKNLKVDLSPIIKLSQSKGYNAGGKEEVIGIILPEEEVNVFLKDLVNYLKRILKEFRKEQSHE